MKNIQFDVASFCDELKMMLEGGILIRDGIEVLADQAVNKEEKALFSLLVEKMDEGKDFCDALEESGYFNSYFIQMVKIGRESGREATVFEELSRYYSRMNDTKEKVKDAFTYPMILIAMMVVVLMVLLVKVLPMFQQVLNNLGTDIAPVAKGFMAFGSFLSSFSFIFIFLAVVIVIVIIVKFNKSEGDFFRFIKGFPFTKGLLRDLATAQFAFAMSQLMASGISDEMALQMLPDMISDETVVVKVKKAAELVEKQVSFAQAANQVGLFNEMMSRYLTIGYQSGKGEDTMAVIARRYEDEIDASIAGFLNKIEPSIVALLAILVGFILLSVMLPLMGIMLTL